MLLEHTHFFEQTPDMPGIAHEFRLVAELEMPLPSKLNRNDLFDLARARHITMTRFDRKTASLIEWVMNSTLLPSSRDS